MQSNVQDQLPNHVAIIMDGNGRWAQRRGLPRRLGHRMGAVAVRRIVEQAVRCRIGHLTLFAFSSDNWQRPGDEVGALMSLFERYLRAELPRCIANGVRLDVIGRRDRLSQRLEEAITNAQHLTRDGQAMTLRLAVDYSSRWVLEHACSAKRAGRPLRQTMAHLLHGQKTIPDVDLLIRTGGERRLSDFLLLESAYAELYFTPLLWPDFRERHLQEALSDYLSRSRRFGACPNASHHNQEVSHGPSLGSG